MDSVDHKRMSNSGSIDPITISGQPDPDLEDDVAEDNNRANETSHDAEQPNLDPVDLIRSNIEQSVVTDVAVTQNELQENLTVDSQLNQKASVPEVGHDRQADQQVTLQTNILPYITKK